MTRGNARRPDGGRPANKRAGAARWLASARRGRGCRTSGAAALARRDPHYAARIREIMEEYLPLIRVRYAQTMEVNGRVYEPPEEERGVERLMTLYNRRLQDIFGRA